jgi:hypothetical protein
VRTREGGCIWFRVVFSGDHSYWRLWTFGYETDSLSGSKPTGAVFLILFCETNGTAATPGLWRWLWRSRWNVDWQGKPKFSEKTWPSATFVHQKIPHDQTRVWTRAAAVGSRRLTAWGMARPTFINNRRQFLFAPNLIFACCFSIFISDSGLFDFTQPMSSITSKDKETAIKRQSMQTVNDVPKYYECTLTSVHDINSHSVQIHNGWHNALWQSIYPINDNEYPLFKSSYHFISFFFFAIVFLGRNTTQRKRCISTETIMTFVSTIFRTPESYFPQVYIFNCSRGKKRKKKQLDKHCFRYFCWEGGSANCGASTNTGQHKSVGNISLQAAP